MKKLGLFLLWAFIFLGMYAAHMSTTEAQRGDPYGGRALQSLEQLLNADGVTYIQTGDGITTITEGQLLLPPGVVGAPSMTNSLAPTTGYYFVGNELRIASNGVMVVRIAQNFGIQDGGTAAVAAFSVGADPNTGLYSIAADNIGMTVGGALVMDWEDTNAAGTGADLVTISSTMGIMDSGDDVVRFLYVDIDSVDHTGGNIIGSEMDLDTADPNAVGTAYLATGAWDYTIRQTGTAFAMLPAAEVGALVYCTNCDLASVPCTSTPGPGAWAFGTSTGPRWECPW